MSQITKVIDNIKIDDDIVPFISELEKGYLDYIDLLHAGEKDYIKRFLKAYSYDELVISNQMEGRSALISYFISGCCKKKNYMTNLFLKLKENGRLTHGELKELHYYLMKCDSRNYIIKGEYRIDDAQIGYFDIDKKPVILYEAPHPDLVPELMGDIIEYYNQKMDLENIKDHPFIKSAIAHALVAHVQPFQDGNSRVGRTLHSAKLWSDANERFNIKVNEPAFFFSRNYSVNRGGYRGKINAVDNDFTSSEAWNKWIYYNLQIMHEVLTYLPEEVNKAKIAYDEIKQKRLI